MILWGYMETVGNKVQVMREEKGVRQVDLADSVNVTRQTIIALEKGNYTPSVVLALKIAKYFNKKVEDIFNIQNN